MLANQGIIFFICFCFVKVSFNYCTFCLPVGLVCSVFAMCLVHMDCIYLVPSTSSFHIVYFCGMYVPVKMQICVFIFNLQYM